MWCAMITGKGREEQMQRACERHIDNKALLSKCFLPLKQEIRMASADKKAFTGIFISGLG